MGVTRVWRGDTEAVGALGDRVSDRRMRIPPVQRLYESVLSSDSNEDEV
jgi:hypothetical protein